MGRILLGILIGLTLASSSAYAFRTQQPVIISEWNPNTFSVLNDILLQMWNLTNGRYQLNSTASDPDGSRRGEQGEELLWTGTPNRTCTNVDGITDWDCVDLTA